MEEEDDIFFEEVADAEFARQASAESHKRQRHNRKRARRKIAEADALNEVGVVPDPDEELLALREHYANDYVDMHYKIFTNSTGIKPFGKVQIESVKHTHHTLTHGGRIVIAEPRGYGKTTRTSNNALAAVLQGKVRFIVILASSLTKAEDIIESIKTELVDNEELAKLYPATCACFEHLNERVSRAKFQTYGGEPTNILYSKSTIRFPTIPGEKSSGSVIMVRSKDNVRGMMHKVKYGPDSGKVLRPDFVFLDDIQTDEEAESPTTVKKIIRTIKKSVMFAGSHAKRISVVNCCTPIAAGDVASHFILNEPGWSRVVTKMLEKEPCEEGMHLWMGEYARILLDYNKDEVGSQTKAALAALEFYKQNQEVMDRGAVVTWDWAYGWAEDPQVEITALQHAMNFRILEGEDSFQTECQCNVVVEDKELGELKATEAEMLVKIHRHTRFYCPIETKHIVTHIDVNESILTYMTVASPDVIEPHIIDYGTYPKQPGMTWKKGNIMNTIQSVYSSIPETNLRVYQALYDFLEDFGNMIYKREDGVEFTNHVVLIDSSGRMVDEVVKVCRESSFRSILTPTYGHYYGAKERPMSEKNYGAGAQKFDHCVHVPRTDNLGMSLLVDTNYMKTKAHEGWKTRMAHPTSISIFPEEYTGQHSIIYNHNLAEDPFKDYFEREDRTVTIWKNVSRNDNEYFDNLVGCLAGLCKRGAVFRTRVRGGAKKSYNMSEYMKQDKSI